MKIRNWPHICTLWHNEYLVLLHSSLLLAAPHFGGLLQNLLGYILMYVTIPLSSEELVLKSMLLALKYFFFLLEDALEESDTIIGFRDCSSIMQTQICIFM